MAEQEKTSGAQSRGRSKGRGAAKTNDPLKLISAEIENMTFDQMAPKLKEADDEAGLQQYRLGGMLARIYENEWFRSQGFESMRDYARNHLSMDPGKVSTLMKIYRTLTDLEVEWPDVKGIGWTNMRALLPVLSKDNCQDWFKAVRELPAEEWMVKVKAARSSGGGGSGDTVRFGAKLHKDQFDALNEALASVMQARGCSTEAEALACLADVWMSSLADASEAPAAAAPAPVAAKNEVGDLRETLASYDPQESLTVFEQIWGLKIDAEVGDPKKWDAANKALAERVAAQG